MPRTKALSTRTKELAKELSPEQMKALAEQLIAEAEKPRIDKKEMLRLERDVRMGHARLANAEETLKNVLHAAGHAAELVVEKIDGLKKEGEKLRATMGSGPRRRGRARKPQPPA